MKIPRFSLLAVSAVFALGLAGGLTPVRADPPPPDAGRRAAAEEFLRVRKTEDLVNSTVARMGDMTDRISDSASKQAGPSVNQQEFSQKLRSEARAMITKELNWEAMKGEFVQAYSQAFTEAELKEMTAFYADPNREKTRRHGTRNFRQALEAQPGKGDVHHAARRAAPARTGHGHEAARFVARVDGAGAPAGHDRAAPAAAWDDDSPPPPPGAVPSAPPSMIPPPAPPTAVPPPVPPAPVAPSGTAAPSSTSAVHPGGKTEPGTP